MAHFANNIGFKTQLSQKRGSKAEDFACFCSGLTVKLPGLNWVLFRSDSHRSDSHRMPSGLLG